MKYFILLLSCGLLFFAACSENEYAVESILELFDEDAVAVMSEAQEVISAISSDRKVKSDEELNTKDRNRRLCDYEVSVEGRQLTSEESEVLISLLLDESLYTHMPYLCIFQLEYAFTFMSPADTVTAILSSECIFVWLCDGEEKLGAGAMKATAGPILMQFVQSVWGSSMDRGSKQISQPN